MISEREKLSVNSKIHGAAKLEGKRVVVINGDAMSEIVIAAIIEINDVLSISIVLFVCLQ
ncbi:hypothetical protein D3C81_1660210 [compost metagenome]